MSIDFTPYVNLRVYDKDPGEVYLTAIDLMRQNVPQLSVRPGTIEDAMIQSFAFLSTLAINRINALPNRLIEGIANLMGVRRSEPTYATVGVTVQALDYAGGALEAGMILEHSYSVAGQRVSEIYETQNSVIIEPVTPVLGANPPTPLPTAFIQLAAVEFGQRRPIAENTVLTILNSQTVIDSAVAEGDFRQGSLGENDAQFLTRFATQLQSMSAILATAQQIESYVLSQFPFVSRAKAYDTTDAEDNRNTNAPAEPGYVSLFVYGEDRTLSLFERNLIYADLVSKSMAGLQMVVLDMKLLPMTVSANVKIERNADFSSTLAAIKASLAETFAPNRFSLNDEAIRKSMIFSAISSVDYVAFVQDNLTFTCEGTTSDGAGNRTFNEKGCLPLLNLENSVIEVTYL